PSHALAAWLMALFPEQPEPDEPAEEGRAVGAPGVATMRSLAETVAAEEPRRLRRWILLAAALAVGAAVWLPTPPPPGPVPPGARVRPPPGGRPAPRRPPAGRRCAASPAPCARAAAAPRPEALPRRLQLAPVGARLDRRPLRRRHAVPRRAGRRTPPC